MLDLDVSSAKNRGVNSNTELLLESLNNLPKYLENCLKDHINNCFPNGTTTLLDNEVYKLSIQEFNSLFKLPHDSSTESSKESTFHSSFIKFIARLESVDLVKCTIFRTYPLLRNILIVVEAHILYTFKGLNHETFSSKFFKFLLENDRFCYVLDSFYRENRIRVSTHEAMKGFNYGSFLLETSLRALELVCSTLSENNKAHENGPTSEHELLEFFIIFNYMQRILAQFLVLAILKNGEMNQNRGQKRDACATKQDVNGEYGKNEKIIKMSLSTLRAPKYVREHKFINKWSLYFFMPIYHVLSAGFSATTEYDSISNQLLEALVESLNNFAPLLWLEPSKALNNLENLLLLHSINLLKLNEVVSDHSTSLYNQIVGNMVSKKNEKSNKSNPLSSNASSRDLTTYFQKNQMKAGLTEYSKFLETLVKFNLNFLNRLKNEKDTSVFYSSINTLSNFISNVVRIILLTDGMEYLSRKNPNSEMQFFLKFSIEKLWNLSVSILQRFPFTVINALFYYLGSQFNKENVLAQIYVFNAIDSSQLKPEEYLSYIKMLDYVLDNSKNLFVNPVSFENAKKNSKRLKFKYLSIKFSEICTIFVNELVSNTDNRSGMVELFASWCYSTNVYHTLLSKQLCNFVIRLIEAKTAYVHISKYVLDIVLGLCFFTHFDKFNDNSVNTYSKINNFDSSDEAEERSDDDDVEDLDGEDEEDKEEDYTFTIDPHQLNAFNYITILSNSGVILTWLMENVTLPYTCAFVESLRTLLKGIHEQCNCIICKYQCYFAEQLNTPCFCYDSLIVNGNPSISHYLEFINAIATSINTSDAKLKSLSEFFISTLIGVLEQLVTVLNNLQDNENLKLNIAIFKIATKLTNVSVSIGHDESKSATYSSLISLFCVLGAPQLRKTRDRTKSRLFAELLGILNKVLSRDQNDEFLNLHKRLLDILVKKMEKYPLLLLPLGFHRKNNELLVRDYAAAIPSILDNATKLDSHTARLLYSYYVWKFARNNNLDDKNGGFSRDLAIMSTENEPHLGVIVNVFFMLSHKIQDVPSEAKQDWILNFQ
ncbi:conserved hypothetical protein [Theileria orientalis strain Shintoku]|uniref:Uncharacterized protein n=1 Tax=Theileria orientalis strain Shintoku TaxID=869250 RepID=J4C8R8_THEOR|nr:conserved hypothetical protein [Theileria orientalis strain Shintoku]BAM41263.1 conserved hypothetical protein [Theileria orientalis strain Shintoku]|eukprot:XP_009691564.1 conserved hypothetical protein [Theileria orientalis strain Shintoku]